MRINIRNTRFIFVKEISDEGMLIGDDGGLTCLHHNGEHMLGTYYGRLNLDTVINKGMQAAFDELYDDDEPKSLFDFEGQDNIALDMLEELADWMIHPREGVFLENLIFIDETQKEELQEKDLIMFLKEGVTQEQD